MALFGFSDIKFQKTDIRNGPLNALVNTDFERNTYRYPIDLGNYDKAHYVVFYIREQKRTSFSKDKNGEEPTIKDAVTGLPNSSKFPTSASSISSTVSNLGSSLQNFASNIAGQIQSSNFSIDNLISSVKNAASDMGGVLQGQFGGNSPATQGVIDNSVAKIKGASIFSGATTRLTKDAIALYMPDTILFNYSQSYNNADIGNELGGKLAATIKASYESYKEGKERSGMTEGILKALASGVTSAGGQLVQAGAEAVEIGRASCRERV